MKRSWPPQPGLSEAAARALVEYAATLSSEIAAEAPREERRTVYTQLRLVGRVRMAHPGEPGERLGRLRREYVIAWDAEVALKRVNGERIMSKNGLRYPIPQYSIQSDARAGLAISYADR